MTTSKTVTAIILAVMIAVFSWWMASHAIESGYRQSTISFLHGIADQDSRTRYVVEYVPDIVDAFHRDGETYAKIRDRVCPHAHFEQRQRDKCRRFAWRWHDIPI